MDSSTLSSELSSSDDRLSLASEPLPGNSQRKRKAKFRKKGYRKPRCRLRKHGKEIPRSVENNFENITSLRARANTPPQQSQHRRSMLEKVNGDISKSRDSKPVNVTREREERKRLVLSLLSNQGIKINARQTSLENVDECLDNNQAIAVREDLICDLLKRFQAERSRSDETKRKLTQANKELKLLKSLIRSKCFDDIEEGPLDDIERKLSTKCTAAAIKVSNEEVTVINAIGESKTTLLDIEMIKLQSDNEILKRSDSNYPPNTFTKTAIKDDAIHVRNKTEKLSRKENVPCDSPSCIDRIYEVCPSCKDMIVFSVDNKSLSKVSQMDQFYHEWQSKLPNANEVHLKDGSILMKSKKRPGRWAFKLNLKNL